MPDETLTEEAKKWQRERREATLIYLHRSLEWHLEEVAKALRLHSASHARQGKIGRRVCEGLGEMLTSFLRELGDTVRAANAGKLDEDAWVCVLSMPVERRDPSGVRLRMANAPDGRSTLAHHLWHCVVRPSLSTRTSSRPFSRAGQRATAAWEAARGWLLAHPDVEALVRPFQVPDVEELCALARQAYWRPVRILIPKDGAVSGVPERLRPDDRTRSSPEVKKALRLCLARLEQVAGFSRGGALRALATILAWQFPGIWPARARLDRQGRRLRDYVREANLLRRELGLA